MTTDPPETDTRKASWAEVLAAAERQDAAVSAEAERAKPGDSFRIAAAEARAEGRGSSASALESVAAAADARRDPSNLNDPRLQRWVVAGAYLFVLAALGTCVAGGLCLAGAFCDEKECAE